MKTIEREEALEELKIGPWKVSYEYGILASPEEKALFLEPRLCKLLYFLCLKRDSIVSRDYLIENIWQDTIVNNESLTRAIADLRKVLSKNFDSPVKIDTIRKRGYKLSFRSVPKRYILKLKINSKFRIIMLGFAVILLAILYFSIF